ncbi:MAG: peptidase [Rickettsiaceae bacterium]
MDWYPDLQFRRRANYWLSEGFTDYYTKILAARYRISSFEEFIIEINNILKEHYSSPVIDISNTNIKEFFWNNYDVSWLPYLRGFVFALGLNCAIKSINQKCSIEQILKHLQRQKVYFSN